MSVSSEPRENVGQLTEESKGNESHAHIAQANVEASGCSARTDPSQVKHSSHEGLALRRFAVHWWIVILWVCQAVCSRSKVRDEVQYSGGQQELHSHMHTGGEEREVEVEILFREHPLIVLVVCQCPSLRIKADATYDGYRDREQVPRSNQHRVDQGSLDHVAVCQTPSRS